MNQKFKIQNIKYKELKIQNYLKSSLFSNFEVETLIKLRSKTVELKVNFSQKYANNIKCSIKDCIFEESQEHIFSSCQKLLQNLQNDNNTAVDYEDIYCSTKNQYKATIHFIKLMEQRAKLLDLKI